MFARCSRLAALLAPFQRWLLIVFAALGVLFLSSVLGVGPLADGRHDALLVALSLWALSLYAFIVCFRVDRPIEDPSAGWLSRLRAKLTGAAFTVFALLIIGVNVAVALVSLRLVVIWTRGLGGG